MKICNFFTEKTYMICFCLKVRGQISLLYGSSIIFGLSNYPVSEFEVVAEELLMSYSVIKVKGYPGNLLSYKPNIGCLCLLFTWI